MSNLHEALAAWGEHISKDECGQLTTVQDILECARAAREGSIPLRTYVPVQLLTAQFEMEKHFLGLTKMAASGHEGLPPIFYALFAPDVSRVMQPFALTTSGLAVEPVQWQGGKVAKCYKGNGAILD